MSEIPDVKESIPSPEVARFYRHLTGMDFTPLPSDDIDLLIGGDVLYQDPVDDVRVGDPGTPTAYKTLFGWTLFGPDVTMNGPSQSRVNFVDISPLTSPGLVLCSSCAFDVTDPIEDPFRTELSVDDKRAVDVVEKSLTRVGDRLQLAMPWKSDHVSFPNNYSLALKRLKSLDKRLEKNPDLRAKYESKIDDLLQKGYAEMVPDHELSITENVNFLPHHCTGQKFRVVFDCSAEYAGTSLNRKLLSGPDLNNSIVGVLMRFRKDTVAFTADISQMFLGILVPPKDRDALRFL